MELILDIDCGEKTCASSKGNFCQFFKSNLRNQCVCHIFGVVYPDESGWVQRHPDCLQKTKK
jgi:hypothetical protein